MIETSNPEINVDELMAKVREEVARRRAGNSSSPPQPPQPDTTPAAVDWPRAQASLQVAEYHAQVGKFLPGWARLGRVRRSLARLTARFILYLSSFITNQQRQFNVSILQCLQAVGDGLQNLESGFAARERRIGGLEQGVGTLRETIQGLEQGVGSLRETIKGLEQAQHENLSRLVSALAERDNRLGGLAEAIDRVRESLTMLEQGQHAELQRLEGELAQRDGRIDGLEQVAGGLRDAVRTLEQGQQSEEGKLAQREGRIKELERTLYQLKANLILQEHRTTLLLEEARKRLPEPFDREQLQVLVEEDKHRLDALYVSFEDQFRGTRNDIKEGLKVYLPLIKDAGIGTEHMPILDAGCGRGEWLELLKEEELQARGVDINRRLVAQCRERGFEVGEGDVITYLRGLPDASLGAVTGFHLIEHLPFDTLIQFLDETVRVLKPGGIAIFETPNPQNILVGSCNFYLDPTHRHPLPSPLMKFMAEVRGLCRVEVWNLHPYPAAFKVEGSELTERFNEYFYGPQDYAVVGWKA